MDTDEETDPYQLPGNQELDEHHGGGAFTAWKTQRDFEEKAFDMACNGSLGYTLVDLSETKQTYLWLTAEAEEDDVGDL